MLLIQVGEPRLDLQDPCFKIMSVLAAHAAIPVLGRCRQDQSLATPELERWRQDPSLATPELGRQRQADPWGLLDVNPITESS